MSKLPASGIGSRRICLGGTFYMAEGKKSVLLYCDIIHTVDGLTDEEAGKLFKHYLRYINDLNPEPPDRLTQLVFEPIKQNLKRDLVKWREFTEKQRLNGLKGGRPKETQITQAFSGNPSQAKKAVKVTDTVTENVKVTEKENNIDSRKLKFASSLEPFLNDYGRDMLNSFYAYWTEPNKSNTKFRQEMEKTWDVKRRLETWASRDRTFKKVKPNPIEATLAAYHQTLKNLNGNDSPVQ